MVPASGSAPPDARVRADRALAAARGRLGISLALLIAAAGEARPGDAVWKSASLVALEGRRVAHEGGATVAAGSPLELFLVVEGERDGLPVYCTAAPALRVGGRAVPQRMIVAPEAGGLQGAEIRWQALFASDDARTWARRRLDAWDRRWSMELLEFPEELASGQERLGTMRFAAAIVPPGGRAPGIGSDGWDAAGAIRPDEPRGYRVTRFAGDSLAGRAQSFVRLPVVAGLPAAFARNKIALSPIDLVVGAWEDAGNVSLDPLRDAPLDGKEWSWLLDPVAIGVRRRASGAGALVGPLGRGVRWGGGAQPGDVLLVGDHPAILRTDDGDGWLSERDVVLSTATGRVAEAPLANLPGDVDVLRPRPFLSWRERLGAAGYGDLGRDAAYTADLAQACREFQRDRGLPQTGFPDEATGASLDELLAAMDAAATPPSAER
jgi:hypothetical protein